MRTAFLALLSALAITFMAGCASSASIKSARHNIIPAGTHGKETSWTPTEQDIELLEKKLARQFSSPDPRVVSGLAEGIPPYPISDYNIRYTGTGPVESRYILGEAIHKSLPEAGQLLGNDRFAMPKTGGLHYFTVLYKPAEDRIVSVRFNAQ